MYYHRFYTVSPFKPRSIEFNVWSTEDVKKLSVTAIHTHICFDGLNYPIVGGLYDPRLGPIKFNGDPCATCGNSMMKCSGHYGHIDLPFPVFNPLFTAIVANLLKISCLKCHTVMIPDIHKYVLIAQLKLIDHGYLIEVHDLDEYLEEFSYKQSHQVKADMEKMCNEIFSKPPANQCRSADILWRMYVSKIFIKGSAAKSCFNCSNKIEKITFLKNKLYIESEKDPKLKTFLMPLTVKEHLRKLWKKEADFIKALINVLSASNEEYPTDVCFTEAVLVTPSNTRPAQIVKQKPVEHVKNNIYKLILQDCLQIRSIMQKMQKNNKELSKEVEDVVNMCKGGTINEKLHNASHSLQISVNSLLDSNALRNELNAAVGMDKIGLKQLIEKKQGILRKNMMGKRVDYFARSVITPDPLLDVDEIGIPETFAKKLTFPVPVTPWNVTKLRKIVLNGPDVYPGANIVEADDGFVTRISGTNPQSRQGLAKTLLTPGVDSKGPKIVHRHLLDGDVLLINRQPSLHKPSIMAHKARILKGEKTFRLHYANCKAYNADFDGDEMNAHFPQGELARAEAAEIVNVANQYLVPRDGTPLSGLIQDHVVSGVRLSIRGKFFDRVEYHHLVFQALHFSTDDIIFLPPAMLKPKQLWSGKQIISTVIMNLTPKNSAYLNLNSTAKISFNAWPGENNNPYLTQEECKFMSESNVIIKDGELLSGILDKNHVGATHYGLVHCFYELYGGQASTNLLGAFSKLFTNYLQKDGFTLGVMDILVKKKPDRKRTKLAEEIKLAGLEAAKNALDIPAIKQIDESNLNQMLESAYKKNSNFRALVDHHYKLILDQSTNKINKVCLPSGLLQPFPQNNLQLMVQSGAKGSTVNTMQISCLLGQIELEGKRPPLMISGRSLPSFRPYDPSPIAGGFIISRFMTGIQPQEFFFHCMAGREGLIDTAVKTSRSGYLQRCLVKHLEGLIINYDLTVRDSDNSVIQFRYGEDGLDICKSQMLKKDRFEFLSNNLKAFRNKKQIKDLKLNSDGKELKKSKTSIQRWLENKENYAKKKRNSGFLRFCQEVNDDVPQTNITKSILGRDIKTSKLCHIWSTMLHDDTKKKYQRMVENCPDPVIKNFQPDVHFGSVTEKLESMIDEYLDAKNKEKLPFKSSKFKEAIYLKSFSSLCHPGEAVGVLAAQSVGEPSTQMTLNTFHFAGRGEMNVTLGIPRLREILMVASKKIKTPSMEIPFKEDVLKLEKKAEKLRKSLTRVVLKDVLEKVVIKESIKLKDQPIRIYKLLFYHLPKKSYSNNTNVNPERILNYLESKFLVRMMQLLKKHLKMNYNNDFIKVGLDKSSKQSNLNESMENAAASNENANSDESDINSDIEGDGDATEAKLKSRRYDTQEYDEDEDEELEEEEEEEEEDENENEDKPRELNIPKDSDEENDSGDEVPEEIKENKSSVTKSIKASKSSTQDFGIKNIRHDTEHFSWTEMTLWASLRYKKIDLSSLIPKLAESAVIHEVPGIKRAIVSHNKEGVLMLKTEGSYGIWELFKHDRLLDFNKLYSNDVQAVAETYGIEAANNVIVREVQNVFQVYGITVDPRHLSLIADYMTFDGTYQPLNRTGMDNCPSPLQQMTFESTLKYLKNATIRKLEDNLQSPSSSLIVGQESKIGSGLMKLYWK